jgi:hypothetical protein
MDCIPVLLLAEYICSVSVCCLLLQERMHGIESKRRNRTVEETLAMFKEMQVGC